MVATAAAMAGPATEDQTTVAPATRQPQSYKTRMASLVTRKRWLALISRRQPSFSRTRECCDGLVLFRRRCYN